MRYVIRAVKGLTVVAGSAVALLVGASAAFADHGSAWSLRQGGTLIRTGGPVSVAGWIMLGVLAAAIAYVAARFARQERAVRTKSDERAPELRERTEAVAA